MVGRKLKDLSGKKINIEDFLKIHYKKNGKKFGYWSSIMKQIAGFEITGKRTKTG